MNESIPSGPGFGVDPSATQIYPGDDSSAGYGSGGSGSMLQDLNDIRVTFCNVPGAQANLRAAIVTNYTVAFGGYGSFVGGFYGAEAGGLIGSEIGGATGAVAGLFDGPESTLVGAATGDIAGALAGASLGERFGASLGLSAGGAAGAYVGNAVGETAADGAVAAFCFGT